MIFASYQYVVFLFLAFFIHWLLPFRLQNVFLILASYVFYCSWRVEYGLLLLGITLFNWWYARWVVARVEKGWILPLGVVVNLAPLIYFKYSLFMVENLAAMGSWLGLSIHSPVVQIMLPLGISFFTFQGIAYLIDVAAGEAPFMKLSDFMLYKALWPQLIAGPIIRPHEIRDQIEKPRTIIYEDLAEGGRRIVFGLFKKTVLADQLGRSVDLVFANQGHPSFIDAWTGVCGFGLQIYFDFSAYTDIAVGSARLFGFRFPENFNWPYLSRSPQEFWSRWHMSLSRWIRDYVFTPLSFAFRAQPRAQVWCLVVAMAICGLWHGAHWIFVLWGLWHGGLLVLQQFAKGLFPSANEKEFFLFRSLLAWMITLGGVTLGWVLFRSQSVAQAGEIFSALLKFKGDFRPSLIKENDVLILAVILLMTGFMHLLRIGLPRIGIADIEQWVIYRYLKPLVYTAVIVMTIILEHEATAFVYFQF